MSLLYRPYDPKRKPGRSMTPRQWIASRENFLKFQLKGMTGTLTRLICNRDLFTPSPHRAMFLMLLDTALWNMYEALEHLDKHQKLRIDQEKKNAHFSKLPKE